MFTYDQILASAYYVFKRDLTSTIISSSLKILINSYGIEFSGKDFRIENLKDIIIFDGAIYKLKDGSSIDDIKEYFDPYLIVFFETIKKQRDEYYSNLGNNDVENDINQSPKVKKLSLGE